MSENGKGSKVAGDFRTPQWEESKLWGNNKKDNKDRIKCSCGENSFKLDNDNTVICGSCDAVIDVSDWEGVVVLPEDSYTVLTFNGDPKKNYEEYKKEREQKR